jgi:8-oxo-dGTP diphosphatase
MSSGKIIYVAAAALIDKQGKILLAQRPSGRKMAGLWEFPGGKIEVGETPEAALIRELKEEIDIEVSSENLTPLTFASHAYDDFHLFMPVFVCRSWRGIPAPQENQQIAWVSAQDLNQYSMPPADLPLLPHLQKLNEKCI